MQTEQEKDNKTLGLQWRVVKVKFYKLTAINFFNTADQIFFLFTKSVKAALKLSSRVSLRQAII